MSNVTNPIFDANGKYIYFTASTDIGPAIDGFGLGSFNRTTTASVYIAVLSKDEKSPIPPESDDEKDKDEKDKTPAATDAAKTDEKKDAAKVSDAKKDKDKKDAEKPAPETKIDLDGIQQRILALPIPARNYTALQPGKTGIILLGEGNPSRVRSLIGQEKRRLAKVVGSAPMTEIVIGEGEGEVPLRKLRVTLMKMPRVIAGGDVNALSVRLKALTARQQMPKGAVPKNMRPPGFRQPRGR